MSIDELAASAAEELVAAAADRTDTVARRAALEHSLAVRRGGWATAVVAVAALAVLLLGPSVIGGLRATPPAVPVAPPTAGEPSRYTGNGPLLVYTQDGFELVDPTTGAHRQIDSTMPATERMFWSPDGSHVATFRGGPVGSSAIVLDVATGRTRTFPTDEPGAPFLASWGPTGRVHWSSDGTLTVEGTDGLAPVTQTLPKGERIIWVDWSPDGGRAAFITQDDNLYSQLYVVNADGTGLTQLPARPDPQDLGPFAPVWSPDGSKLLYSEVGPIGRHRTHALMTIDPDGSRRAEVVDAGAPLTIGKWETYPIWSPDSEQIAFLGDYSTDEGWHLYVTDLAGHVRSIPTGERPALSALAWQPVP